MTTFSCDLEVPRTDDRTGIPKAWIFDTAVSAEARGFVACLLTYVPPGAVISGTDLEASRNPLDSPIAEMVAELLAAGYLKRESSTDEHYRLVNPDRLPPLPKLDDRDLDFA